MIKNVEAAAVHKYLSWLYGCVCVIFLIVLLFDHSKGYIFGVSLTLVAFALFALHHLISKGAENSKPWSRKASLVVGTLMLIGFPIGTAIGGFLIYCSLEPWVQPVVGTGSIFDLPPYDPKNP